MVKHTQTIRRQKPTNCLSVFDHFVGLTLKGLMVIYRFAEEKKTELKYIHQFIILFQPKTKVWKVYAIMTEKNTQCYKKIVIKMSLNFSNWKQDGNIFSFNRKYLGDLIAIHKHALRQIEGYHKHLTWNALLLLQTTPSYIFAEVLVCLCCRSSFSQRKICSEKSHQIHRKTLV